jgi:hypothetical protein
MTKRPLADKYSQSGFWAIDSDPPMALLSMYPDNPILKEADYPGVDPMRCVLIGKGALIIYRGATC